MPTPAQRTAAYIAQQRTLLGDIAYRAQQSAQRQARRMRVRIINNPQLIPQVPALPVNILQPPTIPQILPIDIDDIGPSLPTNNPFEPPIIPPRPNAMKLKQFLQSQKPPTIPPRPPLKINNPMMNSDNYLNKINNMFGIKTEQPIKQTPPNKNIKITNPMLNSDDFLNRINNMFKTPIQQPLPATQHHQQQHQHQHQQQP